MTNLLSIFTMLKTEKYWPFLGDRSKRVMYCRLCVEFQQISGNFYVASVLSTHCHGVISTSEKSCNVSQWVGCFFITNAQRKWYKMLNFLPKSCPRNLTSLVFVLDLSNRHLKDVTNMLTTQLTNHNARFVIGGA